ncbi:MAG: AEC family transporter [Anaerotardibacter sp.]
MITILLIEKIASLFLIMGVGFCLVRTHILQSDQSKVLSKIMLYAVSPCAIISAFQLEYDPLILQGFLFALGVGLAVQFIQMAVVYLIARPLHLSGLEKMASIYSNTFNLIFPLVGYCLGEEWCIYSLAYLTVQVFFMWTHGKALIEGKPHIEWKRIFFAPNLIALAVGFVMFVTGIRLDGPLEVFVGDMGKLIGPIAMLLTGMIVGGMKLPSIVSNKRVWLVSGIRLLLLPLLVCAFLKVVAGFNVVPDSQSILFITLLAAVTPTASMSVAFSQEYGKEAPYASAINVVSTLLCILTMPLWVSVYYF